MSLLPADYSGTQISYPKTILFNICYVVNQLLGLPCRKNTYLPRIICLKSVKINRLINFL